MFNYTVFPNDLPEDAVGNHIDVIIHYGKLVKPPAWMYDSYLTTLFDLQVVHSKIHTHSKAFPVTFTRESWEENPSPQEVYVATILLSHRVFDAYDKMMVTSYLLENFSVEVQAKMKEDGDYLLKIMSPYHRDTLVSQINVWFVTKGVTPPMWISSFVACYDAWKKGETARMVMHFSYTSHLAKDRASMVCSPHHVKGTYGFEIYEYYSNFDDETLPPKLSDHSLSEEELEELCVPVVLTVPDVDIEDMIVARKVATAFIKADYRKVTLEEFL